MKPSLLILACVGVCLSHAFHSPRASDNIRPGACISAAAGLSSCQKNVGRFAKRQRVVTHMSADEETDPSNTINIAIFSNNQDDAFQIALLNHPLRKMTGVSLSIDWIANNKESSWTKSELNVIQSTDIACFSTISSVKTYLNKLDNHLNADPDLPQEERRKLPNKPDMIADIMGTAGGSSGLVAACPVTETARECLNSGRWIANNIYYPKDGRAVALKTESLEDAKANDDNEEENVEIDVDLWAASVMQAAGDVLETKFWGGGW